MDNPSQPIFVSRHQQQQHAASAAAAATSLTDSQERAATVIPPIAARGGGAAAAEGEVTSSSSVYYSASLKNQSTKIASAAAATSVYDETELLIKKIAESEQKTQQLRHAREEKERLKALKEKNDAYCNGILRSNAAILAAAAAENVAALGRQMAEGGGIYTKTTTSSNGINSASTTINNNTGVDADKDPFHLPPRASSADVGAGGNSASSAAAGVHLPAVVGMGVGPRPNTTSTTSGRGGGVGGTFSVPSSSRSLAATTSFLPPTGVTAIKGPPSSSPAMSLVESSLLNLDDLGGFGGGARKVSQDALFSSGGRRQRLMMAAAASASASTSSPPIIVSQTLPATGSSTSSSASNNNNASAAAGATGNNTGDRNQTPTSVYYSRVVDNLRGDGNFYGGSGGSQLNSASANPLQQQPSRPHSSSSPSSTSAAMLRNTNSNTNSRRPSTSTFFPPTAATSSRGHHNNKNGTTATVSFNNTNPNTNATKAAAGTSVSVSSSAAASAQVSESIMNVNTLFPVVGGSSGGVVMVPDSPTAVVDVPPSSSAFPSAADTATVDGGANTKNVNSRRTSASSMIRSDQSLSAILTKIAARTANVVVSDASGYNADSTNTNSDTANSSKQQLFVSSPNTKMYAQAPFLRRKIAEEEQRAREKMLRDDAAAAAQDADLEFGGRAEGGGNKTSSPPIVSTRHFSNISTTTTTNNNAYYYDNTNAKTSKGFIVGAIAALGRSADQPPPPPFTSVPPHASRVDGFLTRPQKLEAIVGSEVYHLLNHSPAAAATGLGAAVDGDVKKSKEEEEETESGETAAEQQQELLLVPTVPPRHYSSPSVELATGCRVNNRIASVNPTIYSSSSAASTAAITNNGDGYGDDGTGRGEGAIVAVNGAVNTSTRHSSGSSVTAHSPFIVSDTLMNILRDRRAVSDEHAAHLRNEYCGLPPASPPPPPAPAVATATTTAVGAALSATSVNINNSNNTNNLGGSMKSFASSTNSSHNLSPHSPTATNTAAAVAVNTKPNDYSINTTPFTTSAYLNAVVPPSPAAAASAPSYSSNKTMLAMPPSALKHHHHNHQTATAAAPLQPPPPPRTQYESELRLAEISLATEELLIDEQDLRSILYEREAFEYTYVHKSMQLFFQNRVMGPLISILHQSERIDRSDIFAEEKRYFSRIVEMARQSLFITTAKMVENARRRALLEAAEGVVTATNAHAATNATNVPPSSSLADSVNSERRRSSETTRGGGGGGGAATKAGGSVATAAAAATATTTQQCDREAARTFEAEAIVNRLAKQKEARLQLRKEKEEAERAMMMAVGGEEGEVVEEGGGVIVGSGISSQSTLASTQQPLNNYHHGRQQQQQLFSSSSPAGEGGDTAFPGGPFFGDNNDDAVSTTPASSPPAAAASAPMLLTTAAASPAILFSVSPSAYQQVFHTAAHARKVKQQRQEQQQAAGSSSPKYQQQQLLSNKANRGGNYDDDGGGIDFSPNSTAAAVITINGGGEEGGEGQQGLNSNSSQTSSFNNTRRRRDGGGGGGAGLGSASPRSQGMGEYYDLDGGVNNNNAADANSNAQQYDHYDEIMKLVDEATEDVLLFGDGEAGGEEEEGEGDDAKDAPNTASKKENDDAAVVVASAGKGMEEDPSVTSFFESVNVPSETRASLFAANGGDGDDDDDDYDAPLKTTKGNAGDGKAITEKKKKKADKGAAEDDDDDDVLLPLDYVPEEREGEIPNYDDEMYDSGIDDGDSDEDQIKEKKKKKSSPPTENAPSAPLTMGGEEGKEEGADDAKGEQQTNSTSGGGMVPKRPAAPKQGGRARNNNNPQQQQPTAPTPTTTGVTGFRNVPKSLPNSNTNTQRQRHAPSAVTVIEPPEQKEEDDVAEERGGGGGAGDGNANATPTATPPPANATNQPPQRRVTYRRGTEQQQLNNTTTNSVVHSTSSSAALLLTTASRSSLRYSLSASPLAGAAGVGSGAACLSPTLSAALAAEKEFAALSSSRKISNAKALVEEEDEAMRREIEKIAEESKLPTHVVEKLVRMGSLSANLGFLNLNTNANINNANIAVQSASAAGSVLSQSNSPHSPRSPNTNLMMPPGGGGGDRFAQSNVSVSSPLFSKSFGVGLGMTSGFIRRAMVPAFSGLKLPMELVKVITALESRVRRAIEDEQARHFKARFIDMMAAETERLLVADRKQRHLDRLVMWRDQRAARERNAAETLRLGRLIATLILEEESDRIGHVEHAEDAAFLSEILLPHFVEKSLLERKAFEDAETEARRLLETCRYPLSLLGAVEAHETLRRIHMESFEFNQHVTMPLTTLRANLAELHGKDQRARAAILKIQRMFRKIRLGLGGWRRTHKTIGAEIVKLRSDKQTRSVQSAVTKARRALEEESNRIVNEQLAVFSQAQAKVMSEEARIRRHVIEEDELWSRDRILLAKVSEFIHEFYNPTRRQITEHDEPRKRREIVFSMFPPTSEPLQVPRINKAVNANSNNDISEAPTPTPSFWGTTFAAFTAVLEVLHQKRDVEFSIESSARDLILFDEANSRSHLRIQFIQNSVKVNEFLHNRAKLFERDRETVEAEESIARNLMLTEERRSFQTNVLFGNDCEEMEIICVNKSYPNRILNPFFSSFSANLFEPFALDNRALFAAELFNQEFFPLVTSIAAEFITRTAEETFRSEIALEERKIRVAMAASKIDDVFTITQAIQRRNEMAAKIQKWVKNVFIGGIVGRSGMRNYLSIAFTPKRERIALFKQMDRQRDDVDGARRELFDAIRDHKNQTEKEFYPLISKIVEVETRCRQRIDDEAIFMVNLLLKNHRALAEEVTNANYNRLVQQERFWRQEIIAHWLHGFVNELPVQDSSSVDYDATTKNSDIVAKVYRRVIYDHPAAKERRAKGQEDDGDDEEGGGDPRQEDDGDDEEGEGEEVGVAEKEEGKTRSRQQARRYATVPPHHLQRTIALDPYYPNPPPGGFEAKKKLFKKDVLIRRIQRAWRCFVARRIRKSKVLDSIGRVQEVEAQRRLEIQILEHTTFALSPSHVEFSHSSVDDEKKTKMPPLPPPTTPAADFVSAHEFYCSQVFSVDYLQQFVPSTLLAWCEGAQTHSIVAEEELKDRLKLEWLLQNTIRYRHIEFEEVAERRKIYTERWGWQLGRLQLCQEETIDRNFIVDAYFSLLFRCTEALSARTASDLIQTEYCTKFSKEMMIDTLEPLQRSAITEEEVGQRTHLLLMSLYFETREDKIVIPERQTFEKILLEFQEGVERINKSNLSSNLYYYFRAKICEQEDAQRMINFILKEDFDFHTQILFPSEEGYARWFIEKEWATTCAVPHRPVTYTGDDMAGFYQYRGSVYLYAVELMEFEQRRMTLLQEDLVDFWARLTQMKEDLFISARGTHVVMADGKGGLSQLQPRPPSANAANRPSAVGAYQSRPRM